MTDTNISRAKALLAGVNAKVKPGQSGHEREILVNIEGYGHSGLTGTGLEIPLVVVAALKTLLPTWLVETRGSRIELHPSGGFSGGYDADKDPDKAVEVLTKLCAVVALIQPPAPAMTPEQMADRREAIRSEMLAKLAASKASRLANG